MQADLRWVTTEEERAAVYRLRYELYVEGQGLFHDEADHERRWLIDEDDADSRIAVAEVDGQVVGAARINWGGDAPFSDATRRSYDVSRFAGVVDERDVILLSRYVVRPEHRGGMLAFQLIWKVCELAAERGAELILGSCEPHLVSHYRKLGVRPFGKLYNHSTNGLLVPIVLVTGDFEHLSRVDSPMLGVLRRRTKPVERLDEILARLAEDPAIVSQEQEDTQQYWAEVTHWLSDPQEGVRGVLRELSRDEALVLLAKSHVLSCGAGDVLIGKGHVSRTLYVLLSGSLEVHDNGEMVALVEERGAVVGEVASLLSTPRISDVVAGPEGARVLALSDSNLREIIAGYGPLAAKFLLFVARGTCQKLMERVTQRRALHQRPSGVSPIYSLPVRSPRARPPRSRRGRRTSRGGARRDDQGGGPAGVRLLERSARRLAASWVPTYSSPRRSRRIR